MNGRLNGCPFFLALTGQITRKTTQNMPFLKIRLRRIAPTECLRVGKVFVPLKFDALKTAPMRLNGQNRFRVLFSRIKMMVILGLASYLLYP